MEKINAVITGVGGYVPDYILTNEEISKMVDTTDEWIMGRIGIKERRILHEEGLGTSYMARKAVKQLMQRTKSNPDDIDLVIVATTTADYHFPSTASILCERVKLKNPEEARKLQTELYQQRVAAAVADGIDTYLHVDNRKSYS